MLLPQNVAQNVERQKWMSKMWRRRRRSRKRHYWSYGYLWYQWQYAMRWRYAKCTQSAAQRGTTMHGGGGAWQVLVIIMRGQKPNVKYATSKTEAEWKRMENTKREIERERREEWKWKQSEGELCNIHTNKRESHTHTERNLHTQRHIISSRRDGKCQTFCPNAENLHAKPNGTVRE